MCFSATCKDEKYPVTTLYVVDDEVSLSKTLNPLIWMWACAWVNESHFVKQFAIKAPYNCSPFTVNHLKSISLGMSLMRGFIDKYKLYLSYYKRRSHEHERDTVIRVCWERRLKYAEISGSADFLKIHYKHFITYWPNNHNSCMFTCWDRCTERGRAYTTAYEWQLLANKLHFYFMS